MKKILEILLMSLTGVFNVSGVAFLYQEINRPLPCVSLDQEVLTTKSQKITNLNLISPSITSF